LEVEEWNEGISRRVMEIVVDCVVSVAVVVVGHVLVVVFRRSVACSTQDPCACYGYVCQEDVVE
jgi:hypothetical protein